MESIALSADTHTLYDLTSANDEKISLLYSVLPKILRTRIRKLPSWRRSVSQYVIGTEPSSSEQSRRTSQTYSDLETPPPGYRSRISLSEPVSDSEGDDILPLRPLSSCSSVDPVDNSSGILWKFANQGLSLLNIAAQEDKSKPQGNGSGSTSLSRSLYVHGVTYVLRGLPTDLSVDEKMGIWSSIPPDVQQVSPIASSVTVASSSRTTDGAAPAKPEQTSVLQQVVASLIVQLFIISQFLLPYIKYCFAILYRYERKHKVSERVIASSVQTCEGVMRTSLQITDAICAMNDGKVGRALNEMSIWWISGVTAGIHQGVGDGLAIVGAKNVGGADLESKKRR